MEAAASCLWRCDPAIICSDWEQPECLDTSCSLAHLTNCHRAQKVQWRQLIALDSMMDLLQQLDSSHQLLTRPHPPQPGHGARGRWKAVKADSSVCVQETEALLAALHDRISRVHSKSHQLTQLLQQQYSKRELSQKLRESLQKAQNALHGCDHQHTQLRVESEAARYRLAVSQQGRDGLHKCVSAVQESMQLKLLSSSQMQMCIELKPCPLSANNLEPLRLSLTWCSEQRFSLQVVDGASGLLEEAVSGSRAELSAALLELMQTYEGQAGLLSEIQALRASFAIDWLPAQRLLVYLKSSSVVCELAVPEGYPNTEHVRLQAVRRDGRPVNTRHLQLHQSGLSLTEWLVLLCSSSHL